MDIISFLPILAAGITSVVIGAIWYSPFLFGNVWARHAGLTPEMMEKGKRRMPFVAFFGLLISMLIAYVMQDVGIALNTYDVVGAFVLGLWCWLGFAVPVVLSAVVWEQKSFVYLLITLGYWFVSFVAMALVMFYVAQLFTPMLN